MRSRSWAMLFVVLALLGVTAVLPAAAEISDPSAGQLAEALASGSNVITGAEYVEGPPSGQAVLVATEAIAGFVTLVVTDDRELTDFHTVNTPGYQVDERT